MQPQAVPRKPPLQVQGEDFCLPFPAPRLGSPMHLLPLTASRRDFSRPYMTRGVISNPWHIPAHFDQCVQPQGISACGHSQYKHQTLGRTQHCRPQASLAPYVPCLLSCKCGFPANYSSQGCAQVPVHFLLEGSIE
jgi:hypothetical protein